MQNLLVHNLSGKIYKHLLSLTFGWTSLIFILCATPGQFIPSANWLELLSFDKFVHAGIFFVLSALLFLVQVKYKQALLWRYCYLIGVVLYGILLELMQARFFSNRSADWKDAIADSFGCIMALLFFKRIRALFITSEMVN